MFSIFKRQASSQPQPLFFDTDIHCHVIPGIDDGAPDLEAGVELVERMEQLGIKRIFASPHITQVTFENSADTIDGPFQQLKSALDSRGCAVELNHWAENRIDELFFQNFADGKLMTIPGNRVLIENSFMQEPWELDKLIFDLLVKGYKPILAHPERYSYYYKRLDYLDKMVEAGLALQVNMLSLSGYYGTNEKKMAEALIDKGLVRYLGTDIHRLAHVESIEKYLASKDYIKHREALQPKLLNDKI